MGTDYSEYFLYFNRSVLTRYRASPDIYEIEEDDTGGWVINHGENNDSWYQVRFAFRRLSDRRVCVAAFGFDLQKLSNKEKHIWFGEQLENPKFCRHDPDFKRWVKRNLQATMARSVESGPITKIKREVKLLRSLTRHKLGTPIFEFEWNPLIRYPVAENSEAYKDAHLELYRLLIDGMDSDALVAIATRLQIKISDPNKTLYALKTIMPVTMTSKVHKPLSDCREIRNKKHGIPSKKIENFPAFDTFNKDMLGIAAGLTTLRIWLESILGIKAEICLNRESAMAVNFPKFTEPSSNNFFDKLKINDIKKLEGKTIRNVEFGREIPNPEIHDREAIIFHFTDGTSATIRVGSNAAEFQNSRRKFKPSEFSTDLALFWAPSID